MLRSLARAKPTGLKWPSAAAVFSSANFSDAAGGKLPHMPAIIDTKEILVPDKVKTQKKLKDTKIEVPYIEDVGIVAGIPEEHIKNRRVRIYVPAKNAMQSGTENQHHWEIEFETRKRWENPLMGWTSTGDPLSNMKVEFKNSEDAINYCEKLGYKWYLDSGKTEREERPKSYGVNFSWNKRTRVSTK